MTAVILFSGVAAILVWVAGRRWVGRDPHVTLAAIMLCSGMPLLEFLPNWEVLPRGGKRWDGLALVSSSLSGRLSWVTWVWGVGAVLLLGRLVREALFLRRLRKEAGPVGHFRDLVLLESGKVEAPFVGGIFGAAVFVPEGFSAWKEETRRAVLEHEWAHWLRRDPLRKLLVSSVCALYWWNPLIWWLGRRFTLQIELAADRLAVRKVDAADYAHVLCDLSQARVEGRMVAAMGEPSLLERRIRALQAPERKLGRAGLGALVLILVSAGLGLSLASVKREGEEFQPRLEKEAFPQWEVELRERAKAFPED